MNVSQENSYEFNQFIKQMNENMKTLAEDNSAGVFNKNIVDQQKIDLLKFRIKYEKNIVKKKELEKELADLKRGISHG